MQFEDHLIGQESFSAFEALDDEVAAKCGRLVKALPMTNRAYGRRHLELAQQNNMKPPPRSARIFPGYVVIRNLGRKGQYETWMPDEAFEHTYKARS